MELFVPLRLQLVEPRPEPDDRLGSKAEDPRAGIGRRSLVCDEPGGEEDTEVSAHRRPGDGRGCGELTCPLRPTLERLDDQPTRGVRERLEHRCQVARSSLHREQ